MTDMEEQMNIREYSVFILAILNGLKHNKESGLTLSFIIRVEG